MTSLLTSTHNPKYSEEGHEYSSQLERNSTSATTPTVQQHELPVKSVELFSDLVVAAVVGSLSEQLAGEIPDMTDWLWYWLRVFFVWSLWNNCLFLNDAVDLYGSDNTAEFAIFMNVFGAVFALAALAAASLNDNIVATALIYIFGRIVVTALAEFETSGPRRHNVNPERYEKFKSACRLFRILVPLECMPLLIAVAFFRDTNLGILVGGYATFVCFLVWRGACARRIDSIVSYEDDVGHLLNLDHIRERYEVITLAILGGLCFVDQAGGVADIVSYRALVAALGAFLLFYQALGRTLSIQESVEGNSQFPNAHLLLFCAISSMEAPFSQIVRDRTEDNVEWGVDPHLLLYDVGGAFLVILCFINLLAQDTDRMLAQKYRVALLFVSGVALVGFGNLARLRIADSIIPVVYTVVAAIQAWGTRRIPQWE